MKGKIVAVLNQTLITDTSDAVQAQADLLPVKQISPPTGP
jgi:hypothetical protein